MNKLNLSIFNFSKEKKLFLKILLLAGIMLSFFYLISNQQSESYFASLIDKVERLKAIEEPKIVLLGNSNVAFGFDSQLLEEEFHMPVVNMGFHGGLGNILHEEMARINVTEGDLYILCHSAYGTSHELPDPMIAWVTLENNFELYEILRTEDVWPMIKSYPTYLKNCLKNWSAPTESTDENSDETNVYLRKSFNIYGDVKTIRNENTYEYNSPISVPEISDSTINRINNLAQWLSSKGATLVIAGYPIINGELTPPKEEYEKFQLELETSLNCDIISNFTDYMFDYKYFYDTEFHLTNEGATLRTKQLIKDLQNWGKISPNS